MKVPPALFKAPDAKLPSVSADTVCAVFVKKAVTASEPDLIPKIVTESVAFTSAEVPPSLTLTWTCTVSWSAGSSVSASVNVVVVVFRYQWIQNLECSHPLLMNE